MSLRTNETEQLYQEAKKAGTLIPLEQEVVLRGAPQFYYWKIIANRFPHDLHHAHHALVVLKRECPVERVTLEELEELWYSVVPWADRHFDYVKFNLSSMRSVVGTPHLHLLVLKGEYK
jgi:hypothetical protein